MSAFPTSQQPWFPSLYRSLWLSVFEGSGYRFGGGANFAAFVLANALIAMTIRMKVKIALASALVIASLFYLLPQHPLRALFFAGVSGVLSLTAIYVTKRLAPEPTHFDSHRIKD